MNDAQQCRNSCAPRRDNDIVVVVCATDARTSCLPMTSISFFLSVLHSFHTISDQIPCTHTYTHTRALSPPFSLIHTRAPLFVYFAYLHIWQIPFPSFYFHSSLCWVPVGYYIRENYFCVQTFSLKSSILCKCDIFTAYLISFHFKIISFHFLIFYHINYLNC